MKPVLPLAALFAFSAALPALATEEKAEVKPDATKASQIATTVCAGCHGADGNSSVPVNPNLAGQVPQYITKQLANFKDGDKPRGRKNAIMQGMVATLSPEDIASLGAYFAQQVPKPGTSQDKTLATLGEKLYRGGNSSRGIPACAGCHSPNGAGIPAQFPRLAGQQMEYVVNQLKAFRSGERENDPNQMMQMIAVKMGDQEMTAVAQYLQGLQ